MAKPGFQERSGKTTENHNFVAIADYQAIGLTPPGYVNNTVIENFSVSAGDEISAFVQYALDYSAGTVVLANTTTGQHFGIVLASPAGAFLRGRSVDWIVELPGGGYRVGGNSLANFGTVNFAGALGCGARSWPHR